MSPPVAISIGNFDGVHRGHRGLVAEARSLAGSDGRVVVLAFDPHPAATLRPGAAPPRLTTFALRADLLAAAGADEVVRLEPTAAFLAQPAEAFVAGVVAAHQPRFIVEGPDFRFGRGRSGTIETLRGLEREHGYETRVIAPVSVGLANGVLAVASSTMIRWLLARGRVRDAAAVLGRPYALVGPVARGHQRGRDIGFPTANLAPSDHQLPADGVYAGRARRAEGGPWHAAAISVGTNATFGDRERTCEAHLAGYDGPLDDYGWTMVLEVHDWLRDQVRYAGVGPLVDQIRRDVAETESRYASRERATCGTRGGP